MTFVLQDNEQNQKIGQGKCLVVIKFNKREMIVVLDSEFVMKQATNIFYKESIPYGR